MARATKAEAAALVELAASIIAEHIGARPYKLHGIMAQRAGLSRRQAARYVSRAMARMAAEYDARIRQIAAALPDRYAAALARAVAADDRRTEARLLGQLCELTARAPMNEPSDGPTGFEFWIAETDPQTGELIKRPCPGPGAPQQAENAAAIIEAG